MDGACEPCSLLMLTHTNQVPEVTLIKGTKVFKNVSVLSAYCPKCKTSYFVDHETHGPPNDRLKTYLNDAVYLKVGQNTYVDCVFSNAVVNGIFSLIDLTFNIQACEQLNGWLGGFDSILR